MAFELAKPTTGNGTHARRKAIPANTRVAVAVFLATRSKEGHLRYGTVSLAVKVFYISRAAIEQIWALRNEPSSLVLPRKAYPRRSTRLRGILYRFDAMYDVVHIDAKWFNMYKASTRYYLSADASLPYRPCLNKRYIGKVLFIAAQRCYVLVLGGRKTALVKVCSKITPAVMSTKITEK
ncbi:hypothetical protein F441_09649 [Phytophthora nicotianae CJ01A1]|uniref:Uncharacterized protein n=1 Tax=Phytophthora nicotianae CJ01A1 TaxID=1317063 RepID=W2WYJ0_PHYNI|nr:hypothetical protein F441_09649 [Phytophthora nicotianae CJ01A1]